MGKTCGHDRIFHRIERRFGSWNDSSMNNALYSWFPIVASALDCEYGQQGHSGLGMVRSLEGKGEIEKKAQGFVIVDRAS